MAEHYKFNNEDFSFDKEKRSKLSICVAVLKWTFWITALVCLYYVIYATLVSSKEELHLAEENRQYELLYPKMQRQLALNADVIRSLQAKDNRIYEDIFHTKAPALDLITAVTVSSALDTLTEEELTYKAQKRLKSLGEKAGKVSRAMDNVLDTFARLKNISIPMFSPIRNISYAEVGASIGYKFSPFLKVKQRHTGLDIIASPAEQVYATAKGVVESVEQSYKAKGKQITIRHSHGYITKYAHLNEILVRKGQQVDQNTVIATVGMSGNSFAPHLHYEIWCNGELREPVNYMFGSLRAEEYMNFLYMSLNTQQALD